MTFDLETCYRDHHRLVRWIVRGSGVPASCVDDVVQDVFVSAYRRRRAAPPDDLRRWLVGVAKSVSSNFRRAVQRREVRHEVWSSGVDETNHRVEENVGHRLELERVLEALQGLAAPQRDAFIMVELAGMNATEASSALGVSPNTIASRLRLARRKLRNLPSSVTEPMLHAEEPSSRRVQAVWLAIAGKAAAPTTAVLATCVAGAFAAVIGVGIHVTVDTTAPIPVALRSPISTPKTRATVALPAPDTVMRNVELPTAQDPEVGTPRKRAEPQHPLEREATLLQGAARAIDKQDFATARSTLARYLDEFPSGQLDHERKRLEQRLGD